MLKNKIFSAFLSVAIGIVPVFAFNCDVFAKENEEHPVAGFSITPDTYTISHSGYTDLSFSYDPLQFGFINDDILVTTLELEFPRSGVLSDDSGNSISFDINNIDHNLAAGSKLKFRRDYNENEEYDPFSISIQIDKNDYSSLTPGAYTGRITYSATWKNAQNIKDNTQSDIACPDGSIELSLLISEPESESGNFNDGFFWSLDSDGKLTVTGQGDMCNFTSFSTPWDSCKSEVCSIEIQSGITSIGDRAFSGCSNATGISIPSGVTRIGEYAFSGCKFTNVIIPDGVESIGAAAFHGCDKLTSVILPNSVLSIGDNAFAYCSRLNNVRLNRSAYSAEAFPNSPMQIFRFYYEVNYVSGNNGAISGNSISFGGDYLEVTVTPNTNYEVDKITLDYAGKTVEITKDTSGKYIYTMPDVDGTVTISATFKEKDVKEIIIVTQPTDLTGLAGSTVTFSIGAEGEGLQYKWQYYYNGKWNTAASKTLTYAVNARASLNGMKVRCIVTDQYGTSVTSKVVVLAVKQPAKITRQPEDCKGVAGSTVTFSVGAEGEGLQYKWQYYYNGKWNTAAAKTSTYNVTVKNSLNGMKVRCIVTDQYGTTVTSKVVVLTVSQPAKITKQPESCTGVAGSTVTFSLEAEGEGLQYKWQYYYNGKWNTAAAKTSTYAVKARASLDGMNVRCIVTDEFGTTVTSKVVVLTVKQPAKITVQPEDCTAQAGKSVTFSVVAEGEGLQYKWQYYYNGKWNSAAAKTSTYVVSARKSLNGMKVRCIVTDQYGTSVTSQEAVLTVN